MANEITAEVNLNLTRAVGQLVNWESGAVSFTQIGSRMVDNVQNIGTAAEALEIGTIGTLGYMLVQNMYTTAGNIAYLYSSVAGVSFGQLNAGEFCLFKVGPGVTAPAAKFLSTASQLRVIILEL